MLFYLLKYAPPYNYEYLNVSCTFNTVTLFAGDNRANENMALAVLQTAFLREHNRIASELGNINPLWDDEKIYQVQILIHI
jgi:hypothetical protein